MAISFMDTIIIALQYVMTLGVLGLAILLFWHLQRIHKPTMAFIFWSVVMLCALTPFFNVIQANVSLSSIPLLYLFWILIVPLLVALAYFFNPLAPKRYAYEDDDPFDDDADMPTYH